MNPILEGWKCPSCFLVHAPFVKSCDCMVVRARDPASPPTMNEAVSKNEVMDAWVKMREAELVGGDQWGGRDRPFNECRPVAIQPATVDELVNSASAALDDAWKGMDGVKAANQKLDGIRTKF